MDGRSLLIASVALCAGCFTELGDYTSTGGGGGGTSAIDDRDDGGSIEHTVSSTAEATTGGSPVEMCSNGDDDDGDGKVDCQDEDCGGYVCIPAPSNPAFAAGPHLLVDADSQAPCDPAFPDRGLTGQRLVDAPSPCDCSCGAAAGQACAAEVDLYAAPSCAGAATAVTVAGGVCTSSSASAQSASVSAAPAGGSCSPSSVPPVAPTFAPIRSCAAPRGGGCEEGFVCARPQAPTGEPSICFEAPGDVACDDLAFPLKVLVFDGIPVDGRTCSGTCGCATPAGGSCNGSVIIEDGACGGAQAASILLGSGCSQIDPGVSGAAVELTASVATAGSCAPIPRTVLGGFEGTAHTLCCAEGF
ncbi:MAG TPA: hypothetical protein VGF17_30585 [Phytomonospora sp.]